MSWVILALTLGASITSIIQGVFMLFGTLSVNTGALFEVSTTILACLPVVSAIFALIGGIIAFNKSKWGALFLIIAGGLCVPSKDMWLYGGIYFFATLLCFFLKPDRHDDYEDFIYEDEEPEDNAAPMPQTPQYYLGNTSENYEEEENEIDYLQGGLPHAPSPELNAIINAPVLNADVGVPVVNNEPPKLRRRMSKTCPTCGATVAREARFCSTCGTALLVPAEELLEAQAAAPSVNEIQNVNPGDPEPDISFAMNDTNFNANDGDDMSTQTGNPKVFVKPKRDEYQEFQDIDTRQRVNSNINAAASSYQKFSKYTRRSKKPKRSTGRKILSMLVLVAALGGGLYFLLGLRKLPPGELPPIARDTVINSQENAKNNATTQTPSTSPSKPVVVQDENIAVPGSKIDSNNLPEFTPEREPKTGMVVGSNVNVRADHSTTSNRVARLNVSSKVEIIGTYNVTSGQYQGIWYNVTTGGKEGWIYGRYVQPLGSGIPSGYSNALLKSFGNNKQQLINALGQPTRNTSTTAEWPGLTATFKNDELTRIRVTNSQRELQNGLKVGMSQTALLQILGYPSGLSNKILQYNEGSKTGVSVQLDKNNAISSITVNQI